MTRFNPVEAFVNPISVPFLYDGRKFSDKAGK